MAVHPFSYASYTEEVWNSHNPEALAKYFAADAKVHSMTPGSVAGTGLAYLKERAQSLLNAFPDIRFLIEEVVVQGDVRSTQTQAAVETLRTTIAGDRDFASETSLTPAIDAARAVGREEVGPQVMRVVVADHPVVRRHEEAGLGIEGAGELLVRDPPVPVPRRVPPGDGQRRGEEDFTAAFAEEARDRRLEVVEVSTGDENGGGS